MSAADSAPHRRGGLHAWLASPPGSDLLAAETREARALLADLFGYHLVQVGDLAGTDLLATSRIPHRVIVDIDDGAARVLAHPSVRGAPNALPFESHEIDVVVLPHVLEFVAYPHDALREAFRVLVPEGHLVVCGFNPWSLLGVWRLVRRRRGVPPWSGQFLGHNRLEDWLAVLGFDVLGVRACLYRPPFRSERLMRRLRFVEAAGARLSPYLAGAYVLLARKRVTTLTPLRPQWKPRRRLVEVGLAGPSSARMRTRHRS